ncbi:MAG: NUDIX domain-containing protein [archaeon]|nr:MAG: NUDIX domain-containing protein [archaeon]
MREGKIHRIEVHVATICFKAGKVLIAKRTQERKLYPGLWECGGGLVRPGENFIEAVKREAKDELGVIVDVIGPSGTYEIPVPGSEQKKIPGLKFACRVTGFLDGEPQLSKEHTEWKWVSLDQLDGFDFIPGIPEDVKEAYKLLR